MRSRYNIVILLLLLVSLLLTACDSLDAINPFNPTPTLTATNTQIPTATPGEKDAILLYYFNLEDSGRYGCGEALYWLNTGIRKSGSYEQDIQYAMYRQLAYRGRELGVLYNPGYASTLSVSSVEFLPDGTAVVNLSGSYVPGDDPCDGARFRDQLKQVVRQFPLVSKVRILINGVNIGDATSRK
ncbi:GerMN domain-containing protein [Chloroflexota bacterium]